VSKESQLNSLEVTWITALALETTFAKPNVELYLALLNRVSAAINESNCLASPYLLSACLRVLHEAGTKHKGKIADFQLLLKRVLALYFKYSLVAEECLVIEQRKDYHAKEQAQLLGLSQFRNQPEPVKAVLCQWLLK